MTKGYDKAGILDELSRIFEKQERKNQPCIFLSHKKEDNPACRKIDFS
jgi:hypothetical protein